MKAIKHFFCIKEFKTYKIGDEYTGKRKDLKGLVDYPKSKK
jgi:hypothetical protein